MRTIDKMCKEYEQDNDPKGNDIYSQLLIPYEKVHSFFAPSKKD